jgi:hypothetical protein
MAGSEISVDRSAGGLRRLLSGLRNLLLGLRRWGALGQGRRRHEAEGCGHGYDFQQNLHLNPLVPSGWSRMDSSRMRQVGRLIAADMRASSTMQFFDR